MQELFAVPGEADVLDEVAKETGLGVDDALSGLFGERELLLVRGFFA